MQNISDVFYRALHYFSALQLLSGLSWFGCSDCRHLIDSLMQPASNACILHNRGHFSMLHSFTTCVSDSVFLLGLISALQIGFVFVFVFKLLSLNADAHFASFLVISSISFIVSSISMSPSLLGHYWSCDRKGTQPIQKLWHLSLQVLPAFHTQTASLSNPSNRGHSQEQISLITDVLLLMILYSSSFR